MTALQLSPSMPQIAVIGSGYWGKNLIRNHHRLGALRVICDKNETVLATFKGQYPDVDTCIALNDVLSNRDVKGVVIATPAETHFRIAREALLAGRHVYVEKPLVLDETEGAELIRLSRKHELVLMVGHLLQYHPVFERLRTLASSGELGRINYIYSHRLNLGKIRREENILWSFAPHDISMILSLAGEEPEAVIATGGNFLHKKIADVTTTHMEFHSGLRAHIFVSWLHPFKEQKLVVVGDRKMAVFDDTRPWPDKLLLYPHEIKWQNNIPVIGKAEPERVETREEEPLKLECEYFLKCVSKGRVPRTDGEEGLRVLKILNASQRSLEENSRKIFLESKNAILQEHASNRHGQRTNLRQEIYCKSSVEQGYFAHETTFIDDGCEIGSDTKIWHFSHVLSGSTIGKKCSIGQNVVIGPDVSIGDGCKIQNNVSVYKGVTVEDGVFCGPSVVFTNVYNPRAEISKMDQVKPTVVKRGTTIGANATIICGVTLGAYSFVGAGAVITKNVHDHALMLGNPARQVGWMCHCGERLTDDLECLGCGHKYEKERDGLRKLS